MLKVTSTEMQNNFGRYLLLAQEQDILITRNGQVAAVLSGVGSGGAVDSDLVAEKALSGGYGLRKATYEEFLALTKDTEARYEYIDGEIYLLASPKLDHQLALTEILVSFYQYFDDTDCTVLTAPYDIRIKRSERDINVVQPDIMVICDLDRNLDEDGNYQGVPTLVAEILSESTRRNDLIKKLDLYMVGGVKEYWIVDPKNKAVTVYTFDDHDISEHLTYKIPDQAWAITFPDLAVDLERTFPGSYR